MIHRQFLKVTAATLASGALSTFASRRKDEDAQNPAAFHAGVPDVIADEARWLWAAR